MAIREDLVASAAKFLQDPSVASSPVEKRIAFLQAKNLTQEEVNAALALAASEAGTGTPYVAPQQAVAGPVQQPQAFYGQYPPYGWQPPAPEAPRRDWRDWFIMATVVGGVGYGLYTMTKRYVYPLIAPPTPGRLEEDKKAIDEQFEKAFALVEQLAKDTEALKAAEKERTERLDTALAELETVMVDLKAANKRREDDAERIRDDVRGLKDALPKALDTQKEVTDHRLKDINQELKSLKMLIGQRMNPAAAAAASSQAAAGANFGSYLRPSSGNASPAPSAAGVAPAPFAAGSAAADSENVAPSQAAADEAKPRNDFVDITPSSVAGRSSPFSSGMPTARASIPAWQRSMAAQSPAATATTTTSAASPATNGEPAGSAQQNESGSSSSS